MYPNLDTNYGLHFAESGYYKKLAAAVSCIWVGIGFWWYCIRGAVGLILG